jgi:hypothetical protein
VLDPNGACVTTFPKPIKSRDPDVDDREEPDQAGGASGRLKPAPPSCHVRRGRLMNGEQRRMYSRRLERVLGYDAAVPIGALFLLERHPDQPTLVSQASRDGALQTVLEQTIRTRAPGLGAVKILPRLLASGAVFRCRIGEDDAGGAVNHMAAAFRQIGRG